MTDETAPKAFAVILAAPTAKKIPNIAATIKVVAQTRKPCMIPSMPANLPATNPPAAILAISMMAEPMPTAAPIPEAGCSDKGSSMNSPILEFRIDSNTEIAKTVITPPKTLPQETLPLRSAKLNFLIIVRFLS